LNFFRILFLPITAPIKFIQENFKTVFFLTIVFYIIVNSPNVTVQKANLYKIDLVGPIIIADQVIKKIQKAKNDPSIKGVLLNVNSPGGAVAPSIEIAYAIKELKEVKPVVVYASGVIASGSYYASIWANKIIANPGSMVGSIGVIMQGANASELMEKIGIQSQSIKVGTFKEVGTPTRVWKDFEKAEIEKVMKDTYDMFITDVSNARGLKKQEHKIYADAHIFTASQSKKVGLIDEVATISKAKQDLIKLSKVNKPIWNKEDKINKFMDKLVGQTISKIDMHFNGLKAY
jgi:protease IV